MVKQETTKPLPVSFLTDQIKKKQVISSEELELQECEKKIKAKPLNPSLFQQAHLIPERKSCPPTAPTFQEFNFAIASRPLKEAKAEEVKPAFKARPLPDLTRQADLP